MVGGGALYDKLTTMMTSDHASVVSLNIFVALLCTCIVIGHLLEENRWINESITALLIVRFVYWCVNIVYNWRKKLSYNGFQ
ncbi:sodium/hydrogen exchanger 2-like [Trifolium medium]|uniref:Sodium/hydrogen exchanger 2-like n=1 Tax=Trifolium medium TaxID=97028 RepID=A0A392QDZ8_9FABA|nr:sodium/hydrogen exchanger 2-like [Trifolium medium]